MVIIVPPVTQPVQVEVQVEVEGTEEEEEEQEEEVGLEGGGITVVVGTRTTEGGGGIPKLLDE